MLKIAAGINTAGALQVWGNMRTKPCLVASTPQCEIANPASGLERRTGRQGSPLSDRNPTPSQCQTRQPIIGEM
jgi:hypothetical protein